MPFMFVDVPRFVLPAVLLLPDMLLLPLMLLLPDMLLLPVVVLFVLPVVLMLLLVVVPPRLVLVEVMFALLLLCVFALVLVLSAGEQADQTPATVSRARRAKVLRIEFPPEPSKVGQSPREPRGSLLTVEV